MSITWAHKKLRRERREREAQSQRQLEILRSHHVGIRRGLLQAVEKKFEAGEIPQDEYDKAVAIINTIGQEAGPE